MLAGCAGGQILSSSSHDKSASLIYAVGDIPMGIQPVYNHGKDDVWLDIPSGGVWVTEGDFLIRDCATILDGDQPVKRVHIAPGRRYTVGCNKKSDVDFADVGPAPSK